PETPFTGLPTGTTMGHIHLKANHLEKAIEFYRDLLGFDLMSRFPGAGFLSKNGYHHHIGVNIWQSRNGEIPPEDATGLAAASFVFGDRSAISKIAENLNSAGYPHEIRSDQLIVSDPAGNTLHLM
ncbi:MAG: VOC family protein, partial [Calditrichaeota bacterium]|nr:VOC family protein [Calditrichota bacterium]